MSERKRFWILFITLYGSYFLLTPLTLIDTENAISIPGGYLSKSIADQVEAPDGNFAFYIINNSLFALVCLIVGVIGSNSSHPKIRYVSIGFYLFIHIKIILAMAPILSGLPFGIAFGAWINGVLPHGMIELGAAYWVLAYSITISLRPRPEKDISMAQIIRVIPWKTTVPGIIMMMILAGWIEAYVTPELMANYWETEIQKLEEKAALAGH